MKTLEKDMNIRKKRTQIKEWSDKLRKNFLKNNYKPCKEEMKKEPD